MECKDENIYLFRAVCRDGLEEYINHLDPVSIFLDDSSDGCSVDYAGNRSDKQVAQDFKKRFQKYGRYFGVAKLKEADVKKYKDLRVKPSPSKNNPFHALIYDVNKNRITQLEAMYLAKISTIYGY